MKKIILGFLSVSIFSSSFCQEIKSYSGEFKGNISDGIANYQYYENTNYERIFHGPFSYKGQQDDWRTVVITGKFVENKKEGTWKYKLLSTSKYPELQHFSSSITGKYERGNLIGEWNFKRSYVEWGTTSNNYSIANFFDNHLVGYFEFNNPAYNRFIKGTFNQQGFFEGEWMIKWKDDNIKHEEIRKYKDGVCYWILQRNLSTGEILINIDNSGLVNQFFSSYSPQNEFTEVEGKAYRLVSSNQQDIYNNLFGSASYNIQDGPHLIYEAIGFWVCKDEGQCHSLMSHTPVDFTDGNYVHEIVRGTESLKESFEKRLVQLTKNEILKISNEKGINSKMIQNIKNENVQLLEEKKIKEQEQEAESQEKSKKAEFYENIKKINLKTYEVMTSYNQGCYPCKKNLYSAFETLSNHFKTQIGTWQYSEMNLTTSRQYVALLDKMIELRNNDTKELEKSLKGITNNQKLIEILGL